MSFRIDAEHALTAAEIDFVEDHLYAYNSRITGRHDGQGLGFVLRDGSGHTVGMAAGYSWAGVSELKQLWIDEPLRGKGHGRRLLDAFIAGAQSRGVRRIWVSSYDFQAPRLYEQAGFIRMAELPGWPEGHSNIILCKSLEEVAPTGN